MQYMSFENSSEMNLNAQTVKYTTLYIRRTRGKTWCYFLCRRVSIPSTVQLKLRAHDDMKTELQRPNMSTWRTSSCYESNSKPGRLPSRYRRVDHAKILHGTNRTTAQGVNKFASGRTKHKFSNYKWRACFLLRFFACNDLISISSFIWVAKSRFT